jgi:hypothetical protein
VTTASVGKIVPDHAASPQPQDEALPPGQPPMTRRAPPPPGEALAPGKQPAAAPPAATPAAAAPATAPAPLPPSSGDSRRIAPPARPLLTPAQPIQFPARADDNAQHFEVARGPRHESNVTPFSRADGPEPPSCG